MVGKVSGLQQISFNICSLGHFWQLNVWGQLNTNNSKLSVVWKLVASFSYVTWHKDQDIPTAHEKLFKKAVWIQVSKPGGASRVIS